MQCETLPTKPILALDVDVVLADFIGRSLELCHEWTGVPVDPQHIKCWTLLKGLPPPHDEESLRPTYMNALRAPGFCASLSPHPEALTALPELRRLAAVYAVTSPMAEAPTWMWERTQWLLDVLGFRHHEVCHLSDKFLIAADALVDDKPLNCRLFRARHPNAGVFMWGAPYNAEETDLLDRRTNDWNDVIRYLESISVHS